MEAAVTHGAEFKFKDGESVMVKNGASFKTEEHNRLYCLNTLDEKNSSSTSASNEDEANLTLDIRGWHEIMGHRKFEDLIKSETAVDDMEN